MGSDPQVRPASGGRGSASTEYYRQIEQQLRRTEVTKTLVTAVSLLALLTAPTIAQTVTEDPLHGYAVIGGVNTNTDSGSVSPINLGGTASAFGFFVSPAPQTDDFFVVELVPNTVAGAPTSILGNVGGGTPFVNEGVYSSGDLAAFLNFPNASPANPFAGFVAGDTAAPGTVTSFTVYEANLGTQTEQSLMNSIMADNIAGAFVTGDELAAFSVSTGACGCQTTISTALSGVLMQTATINPVPGPVAGAGLPGVFTALAGLWALAKRRRARAA
jgi:hypothetical protein